MFLIYITFFAAFLLSGISAWVSVVGLSILFSGVFWEIIVLASASELGKLVAVSYLIQTWEKTTKFAKAWLMFLILTGVMITSAGVYGLLSKGTTASAVEVEQSQLVISGINEEITNIKEHISFIDDSVINYRDELRDLQAQIDNYPKNYASKRIEAYEHQKPRRKEIEQSLTDLRKEKGKALKQIKEINTSKAEATRENIEVESEVAPLKSVAKILGIPDEYAITLITILLMIILEPLAITLLISGNKLLIESKEDEDDDFEPPHNILPVHKDEEVDVGIEPIVPIDRIEPTIHIENKPDETHIMQHSTELPPKPIRAGDDAEAVQYIDSLNNIVTKGDIDKNLFQ